MSLFRGEPIYPNVGHFQPTKAPLFPTNGDVWYDISLNQLLGFINGNIVNLSVAGSSSVPLRRRQALVSADGSTTVAQTLGDVGVINSTVNTVAEAPTATTGAAIGIFSNATNSVNAISGNANYRTGRNIATFFIAGPSGKITDERWWFGLTDQTAVTQGGSDNPAGNYAAFRFSTQAGDSVWQAITKDGTTQNIQSTGVAPVINTPIKFGIVFNDTLANIVFYINGAIVASSATNLPSASTNLRYVLTNESFVSTTNNGLTFEQIYIESDI